MRNSNPKSKIFSRKSVPIAIFLSLSLSFVLFLPADLSNQLRLGITLPMVPFQKAGTIAINNLASFFGRLSSFWRVGEENERLKQEIFRLNNLITKQADIIYKLKSEINSLSDLYNSGIALEKPIVANIIGYDALEFKKNIVIDVGSKYGISINDTVVSGDALIGRISAVTRFTSRVQLITDPAISVPARVLETRDQGIIRGMSGADCQMDYVPNSSNVEKGNKIVTSSIGGVYPDSILIGVVTKSKAMDGLLFRDILVRPVKDVSKAESVLVIRQVRRSDVDGVNE